MSISSRNKEIKVQRDAQSLDHFKNKVAGSEDAYVGLLKPVLAGAGALVLALLAWVGWSSLRARAVERHEVALAELLRSVEGSGATPPSSAEVEKRMREKRRVGCAPHIAPSVRSIDSDALGNSQACGMSRRVLAPISLRMVEATSVQSR